MAIGKKTGGRNFGTDGHKGGRKKGSKNRKFSVSAEMKYKAEIQDVLEKARTMSGKQIITWFNRAKKDGNMTVYSTLHGLNKAIKDDNMESYTAQMERLMPQVKVVTSPLSNEEDWSNEIITLRDKANSGDLTYNELMAVYSDITSRIMSEPDKQEVLTKYVEQMSDMLKAKNQIEFNRFNTIPIKQFNEVLKSTTDIASMSMANEPSALEKFTMTFNKRMDEIFGNNIEDIEEPKKRTKKK